MIVMARWQPGKSPGGERSGYPAGFGVTPPMSRR